MKKVMIVDDEFLVRLGIKSLLQWEDYGYEIAGEAENGQEALVKIEKIRPEIVLTDLMMSPGDGFMLIEHCRRNYPAMKFIVLSNYNDFENVRRAMKLGASDYVFKLTLKAQELVQILEEVSREGERGNAGETGKKAADTRGSHKSGSGRNRDLIKAGILKNLMEAREGYYEVSLKALAEYPGCIDFEEPWRILTITLDNINIARCSGNFLESDLLRFAIENIINEIFEDQQKKEVFQYRECDFILLFSPEEDKEDLQEKVEEAFGRLCQYVQKYCGLHVSGAVGPLSRGIRLLRKRVQDNDEVLNHRFWNRREGLQWVENTVCNSKTAQMPETDKTAILERKIEEEGIQEGLIFWETLMEEQGRAWSGEVYEFREFLLALYRVLAWYLKKGGLDVGHILDSNGVNLETAIREYDFYEDIKNSFHQLQEQYLSFYKEKQKRPCREEIVEVKSFVRAHYGEKLSVAQIAGMVNMSESRFAHVFKKETGISFWEYVNQVRMEHAEKMLKETDLRIGDIAEKIGVDNPNYFSAQFKKRKGKSPLAWRNMTEQGSDRK